LHQIFLQISPFYIVLTFIFYFFTINKLITGCLSEFLTGFKGALNTYTSMGGVGDIEPLDLIFKAFYLSRQAAKIINEVKK
jgi:hypothetical protein